MQAASPQTEKQIAENWAKVQEEVAQAASQANRNASEVSIVGVTKYVDADLTAQLIQAGCTTLGENRPQNLWGKAEVLNSRSDLTHLDSVRWHLIGHLQRNKARRVLPHIELLHSLDSQRLAEALNETSQELDRRLPVLLEVNVTQDSSKTGLSADQLFALADNLILMPNLELRGLMAMASLGTESNLAGARHEFSLVRELRDTLQQRLGSQVQLNQLSMGMSGDYREAILEGSTLVRIGSNLWHGIL
jgi:PLP dependent protein